MFQRIVIILYSGLILTSCASSHQPIDPEILHDHVVRLNREGLMTDPDIANNELLDKIFADPLNHESATELVNNMLTNAKDLADKKAIQQQLDPNQRIPVKLLIHVHGGLNYFVETDQRVQRQATAIQGIDDDNSDSEDWHYPIFISWPSNPVGTWAEQTFLVREGRKTSLLLGALSSPFVILSNIFRGLGKYPITVWYQLVNEKDWASSQLFPDLLSHSWKDSKTNYCSLGDQPLSDEQCNEEAWRNHPQFDENLSLNYSQYHSEFSDSIKRGSLETITFPVRMTLGTVWHSSIAVSAWDNMKRRTLNAFFPTHDFDSREHNGDPQHADQWFSGGDFFQFLLDRIQAEYQQPDNPYQYEITLVGHSMGTIVLNHALKIYRQQWQDTGALKHIVYMAAAASIDDSLDALTPLLVPSNPQYTAPGFYNLVLNRVAEVSETHALGIIPSGSLLVSIDQHYETPEHPMKRTLGSEVNVLSALKAITSRLQGAKSPIVFKAFDRYPGSIPSNHGGFNDLEFWKQRVWNPSTQTKTLFENQTFKNFNAYPELVE